MLPRLPDYAELHCHSNFSFLSGASHPHELVAQARLRGYSALALTDECSLAGVVRAHEAAREQGLRLIVGAEMRLARMPPTRDLPVAARPLAAPAANDTPNTPNTPNPHHALSALSASNATNRPSAPHASAHHPTGAGARLLLLAQSRRGYGNLSQWVTVARRRAAKGSYQALAGDVEGRVPHAPYLAGLPGCFAVLVPEPDQPFEAMFAHAMWLKTWFGSGGGSHGNEPRCAIAVALLRRPHEARMLATLERVAAFTGLPLVASGAVRMHARSRKPLLDVLTATRLKTTVAEAGHALAANAEAHLRSRARLAQLYRPEWLQATLTVASSCVFSLDELRYEYPEEIVPAGHTATSWLRALTEEGAARRFAAGVPVAVRATLEHELALIGQLKFEPYFLTVADIVHWARAQGILCQGRGSAANSAVCYCLGITEVDPARMSLLFERFISAERNEPPDIDVDFEHQRREEVIQYIYRKYGRHRAALTGVVISYRPRSALRDVGRALGFDLQRIDAVAKAAHGHSRSVGAEVLSDNGFDPAERSCRLWLELTELMIGFPRHLSQHPGGFVIARDDLSRLVPVENAAMPGRSVIQWDKDDLDALGLIKVDILALGMLSAIRRALAFVAFKQGLETFTMQQVPAEDATVYDMLCKGDSVGTFQVESRAQMSMLPRLQPRSFYDLVIEVAIVRPGPIQGGMVHPYLRRRSGEEPVVYPSAEVRQALARTLGVPIFQEQVMQLAILAADFTPGEADALRRAMAAWKRKGGLGPFYDRLVGRMVEKGYALEYAQAIFKQIEGFGEYGFPESHAASFALLVYVSAWLKHHHPDAFLAALLNSQPMGFYAPAQLVRDAREHGVAVLAVDALCSEWDTVLQSEAGSAGAQPPPAHSACAKHGYAVRLGLSRISGLAESAAQRLLAARAQAPFANAEDLARRAELDALALRQLAESGALQGLAGHRHQAAWGVAGIDARATPLLKVTRTQEAAAQLPAPLPAQEMLADYRTTGLSLTTHPLALLRAQMANFKVQPAAQLRQARDGQVARASGLVTHRQRPETAKGVVFVTLEDETGSVNIIVWPAVALAYRRALMGSRLLTVYGTWQSQGEVRHLVARRLVDHTELLHGLVTHSRDFR